MDQIRIGRFIAEERKKKGWTQKQLAEKLSLYHGEPGGIRTHDLLIRSWDIIVAQSFINQRSQPAKYTKLLF